MAIAATLTIPRDAHAEASAEVIFRIFLTDGTTIASYGDFTRVGERVAYLLPLDEGEGETKVYLATLPADRVDWAMTERYRAATRAVRYAATRGDEDFAILNAEVAALLTDGALAGDPVQRLVLATEARARLAAWPAQHFGYRADEINQISTWVDDAISDLRVAAGQARFDIDLVAGAPSSPASVMPLPKPTLQESIVQALWAAKLAASPAERGMLLDAALAAIDAHGPTLPQAWVTVTRERTVRTIEFESNLDRQAATLRSTTLAAAERFEAHVDVRGLEGLLETVRKNAAPLLAARGEEVRALMDTVAARLDRVRQHRLVLDSRALEADIVK